MSQKIDQIEAEAEAARRARRGVHRRHARRRSSRSSRRQHGADEDLVALKRKMGMLPPRRPTTPGAAACRPASRRRAPGCSAGSTRAGGAGGGARGDGGRAAARGEAQGRALECVLRTAWPLSLLRSQRSAAPTAAGPYASHAEALIERPGDRCRSRARARPRPRRRLERDGRNELPQARGQERAPPAASSSSPTRSS